MDEIPKTIKVAKIQSRGLDELDEKILNILIKDKKASYKELADALNIKSKTTIGRRAKRLQNEGLVLIYKNGIHNYVKWIGGTPAIESELARATNEHVRASLLAEYYDSMVTNAFSLFSILFEDHYWEILMNLNVGLTDVEIGQRIGDAMSLDSIRRVLVTCDAHDLIKLNTIREPSLSDPIKIFEPLYRIEHVNKEYLEYFIVIRGLASAAISRMNDEIPDSYDHLYGGLLDAVVVMYVSLKDKAASNLSESDTDVLRRMLSNYDFAPDLDRLYKSSINWRKLLRQSVNVKIDDRTDHLIIRKSLSEKYKKTMIERVTKDDS
jgi:DNA-binding Lrp family transcriptional regulator